MRFLVIAGRLLAFIILPAWVISLLFGLVINRLLIASMEDRLSTDVVWTDKHIPAFKSQFRDGQLDARETLGIEPDELPAELLPPTLDEWNGTSPSVFEETLLSDVSLGTFDRFFGRFPFWTIQGVSKERPLRKALINSIRSSDGKETLRETLEEDPDQRSLVNQHFGQFYSELSQSIELKMIRWTNGWIQYFTYIAFWMAVFLLIRNYYQNVILERKMMDDDLPQCGAWPYGRPVWEAPGENDHRVARVTLAGEQVVDRDPGLGAGLIPRLNANATLDQRRARTELDLLGHAACQSNARLGLDMLSEVYRTHFLGEQGRSGRRERASAVSVLEAITQNRLRTLEANNAPILYLAWAIPSIGFIGTVLGIGSALLGAGDMMTPIPDQQKDAIQSVTLELGTAFDTTLIALLLSLVLMLVIYLERRQEERTVLDAQRTIMDRVLPYLE